MQHFGTDLDTRTVIHAWLSSDALIDATSKGYRAIWSVDGRYVSAFSFARTLFPLFSLHTYLYPRSSP